MNPLYLLDTNVVLALLRGGALGAFIEATYGLRRVGLRPLISVVTHGEMRVLAARNGWGDNRRAAMQRALDALVTVDIHVAAVIEAYAQVDIYSQQHPDGARNMGKNDLWIAACTVASGATLLTTDRDFDHLIPSESNPTPLLAGRYIDPSSRLSTG